MIYFNGPTYFTVLSTIFTESIIKGHELPN
jgi:hypothetical protein